MNSYLKWSEKKIDDFSDSNISKMYEDGFVFTRLGKGVMHQTRSVRIDLNKFSLNSENRRILKKVTDLDLKIVSLPMTAGSYDFKLGKLAKDFYTTKFGEGIMSAQKIKEMLTDTDKSNFNLLSVFSINDSPVGYAICYSTGDILHYSYPFYDLANAQKDMGLAMMTTMISDAKSRGLKYVYLGSLQRPTDTYKLQFEGLEWFDGKGWKSDLEEVKKHLKTS